VADCDCECISAAQPLSYRRLDFQTGGRSTASMRQDQKSCWHRSPLNNEQDSSSDSGTTVKSKMEYDDFNDRAIIIKDLKESSIEPSLDACGAGAVDKAEEVGDTEKEDLLSDKGWKYQFKYSRKRANDFTDENPLNNRAEPPQYHSVAQSNEAINRLAGSTRNTPIPEVQPSDVLVTISLARFQQLLVEVIRDGRHSGIRDSDLEHSRTEIVPGRVRIDRSARLQRRASSEPLFEIGLRYSQHLDETRRRVIEDIWNNATPWELSKLDLQVDERLDPTDLVRRCRSNLELHQIFTTSTSTNEDISPAVLDASVLIWHVNKGRQGMTENDLKERSIMFGVIMCCCLAARRGNITIGNILKHVYRIGVLKQPTETQLEDYLEHNLRVIECALAMNRIIQLEPLLTYEDQGWKLKPRGRHRVEELLSTKNSLQGVLGIDLVELFQILHMLNHEQRHLEIASGSLFRVDDLNVKSLNSIGRLCIQWTAIIENHLLLDLEKMTLSIAWSALPRERSLIGGWQSM